MLSITFTLWIDCTVSKLSRSKVVMSEVFDIYSVRHDTVLSTHMEQRTSIRIPTWQVCYDDMLYVVPKFRHPECEFVIPCILLWRRLQALLD